MRHSPEVPLEVEPTREEYHRDHPVRERPTARRSMGGRRDVSVTTVPGEEKMGSVDGARSAVPQRPVPEQRLMAELNLMARGAATPSKKEPTSKCQTLGVSEKMKARLLLLMGQDGIVTDDVARKASSMTKLRG